MYQDVSGNGLHNGGGWLSKSKIYRVGVEEKITGKLKPTSMSQSCHPQTGRGNPELDGTPRAQPDAVLLRQDFFSLQGKSQPCF